jgi:hypothetical protein
MASSAGLFGVMIGSCIDTGSIGSNSGSGGIEARGQKLYAPRPMTQASVNADREGASWDVQREGAVEIRRERERLGRGIEGGLCELGNTTNEVILCVR